jgi:hypothetical protein
MSVVRSQARLAGTAPGTERETMSERDEEYEEEEEEAEESLDEAIARRAYEISQSAESGGDLDNWLRAESEIREGAAVD